jgi:serine/threonine-protein kinase|tara:strand:+ start:2697 stop:5048 length:2352 start_codon:yes stop_codon:yes gene_type:complete
MERLGRPRPFPAYQGDEPYIFVSYSHEDAEAVYAEIQWLKTQGFNIWYDEGINPGEEWRTELAESIEGSQLFLYFITPQSVASSHCQREVNFALDLDKQLLAVHLAETELPSGLGLSLSSIQAILKDDLSEQEYRNKVLSGVSGHIQRGIADTQTTTIKAPAEGSKGLIAAGLLAAILVSGLASWHLKPTNSPPSPVRHVDLNLHPKDELVLAGLTPFAISDDGSTAVYSANDVGDSYGLNVSLPAARNSRSLFLRNLETGEYRPLPGTEGGDAPFFSPDGDWLGFVADDELRRVALAGGSPLRICDLDYGRNGFLSGAVWTPDDRIVFSVYRKPTLFSVAVAGGIPEPLTEPVGETTHRVEQLITESDEILFSIFPRLTGNESVGFGLLNQTTGEVRTGQVPGRSGRIKYMDSGHLVWGQHSPATDFWALVTLPFDLSSMAVRGTPRSVIDEVQGYPGSQIAYFKTTSHGTLIYQPFTGSTGNSQLAWVQRNGEVTPLAEMKPFHYPRVSLDGAWAVVAVHRRDAGFDRGNTGHDLLLYDLDRETSVTFASGGDNHHPLWDITSRQIVFAHGETDLDIYSQSVSEGSSRIRLLEREGRQIPRSFAPDGTLVFEEQGPENRDLWLRHPDGQVEPLLVGPADVRAAAVSPNGRWFAYVLEDSSGEQVYLRPFPGPGRPRRVSPEGGVEPLWSPDGSELYYRDIEMRRLLAVSIEASGDDPVIGAPVALFAGNFDSYVRRGASYSIDPGGQRFLMLQLPRDAAQANRLHLVLNWQEELKRLAPAD